METQMLDKGSPPLPPQSERERGSLILDILIGMSIFALLATIAVTGVNQYRLRAYEQGAISDANSLALGMKADFTDTQTYPATVSVSYASGLGVTMSKGNTIGGYDRDSDSFVYCIEHKSGDTPNAYAVYDSTAGSIVESGRDSGCDGTTLDAGGDVAATPTLPTPLPPPPPPPPPPPVVLSIFDTFNGTGVLNKTEVGDATYLYYNSTASAWSRNSGYATTSTNATSNPMAVVETDKSDVTVTAGVRTQGGAIYYRVVDATNWHRARVHYAQVPVSTQQPGHLCRFDWADGSQHWYQSGFYAPTPQIAEQTYGAVAGTCSFNGTYGPYTTYTNEYEVILDKSVSGTVTVLGKKNTGTTMANYIKVVATGASLTLTYGPTAAAGSAGVSVTDATHQGATKHGIGHGRSQIGFPSGLLDLSIVESVSAAPQTPACATTTFGAWNAGGTTRPMQWSEVAGATSYEISHSFAGSGQGPGSYYSTVAAGQPSYTFTSGTMGGNPTDWWVVAVNGAGRSSTSCQTGR